ncbi:acylphosphatase [Alcanivorax hongdengensis A-11-3]|uniref:acylphosphatase n=1 Tax=Alcanivorax hongdengensis A-11-3 TaxID=1177179 RepID=L0WGR6_9GAMM|nr:acylphosphatase [Alcanivorax hongdengensis]EKF75015.1 acylphosphatase [Alcanivorax hongdengensis A-11-3]
MTILSRKVRIQGRVQGVGYRAWTQQQARQHGLVGWVRNCVNGDVEALLQGPQADVDAMLEACWQGPPAAQVSQVLAEDCPQPRCNRFEVTA